MLEVEGLSINEISSHSRPIRDWFAQLVWQFKDSVLIQTSLLFHTIVTSKFVNVHAMTLINQNSNSWDDQNNNMFFKTQ